MEKNVIVWNGQNLKEVIDFVDIYKKFNEWFKTWEEYEEYVHSHSDVLKLFVGDEGYWEVYAGCEILKTKNGILVPLTAGKFNFVLKKELKKTNDTCDGCTNRKGCINCENGELRETEQKPSDLPKGEDYGIDGLYHAIRILEDTLGKVDGYQTDDGILEHKCAINAVKELYEQKPAWSEKDETTKNNISHIIRQYDKISKRENKPCWYIGDCLLWMQKIKDRVQPQPKQEWSEEDETVLNNLIYELAIDSIGNNRDEYVEWLKSLRPQSLWKPADGDDLPKIDREVIALIRLDGFFQIPPDEPVELTYKVVFAHRPNPDGWDGKSLTTGKVEHYTPKTYGKCGWNIPDIVYWLDVELPKEIEL